MTPSPDGHLDDWLGVRVAHHLLPRWWGEQHVVTTDPEGDVPTLVLVHGWPEHWWAWRHVLRALGRRVRIVAIDTRGSGWSTAEPDRWSPAEITTASIAADVVATVEELDVAGAHLAGHDWGGWFAFRAALDAPELFASVTGLAIMPPWLDRHQVRRHLGGLAYLGPMAAFGDHVARRPAVVRRLLTVSTAAANRSWWRHGEGHAALATYTDRIGQGLGPAVTRRLYRRMVAVELRDAMGPRPPRLAMPGHVLLGDAEPISAEAMYTGRTHADELRTTTIPGCGHWPLDEAPAAVIAHLRSVIGV